MTGEAPVPRGLGQDSIVGLLHNRARDKGCHWPRAERRVSVWNPLRNSVPILLDYEQVMVFPLTQPVARLVAPL